MKDFGVFKNISNETNKNQIEKIMLERDTYQNHQKNIMRDIEERGLSVSTHDSMSKYSPFYDEKKKLRENFLSLRLIKKKSFKIIYILKVNKKKRFRKDLCRKFK